MTDRLIIFDTTLRDGEQSPGGSMNQREKLEVALALRDLGVDVIEAGFPITSPGDFEAVQAIAQQVEGPIVAGLARTHVADIDAAYNAVREAGRPRIHTFISTSDIHIEHQLQTSREDVKGQAQAEVGLSTAAVTREIARTSRLISRLTGYPVQPNKAIVGRNAFAHESGIHQDGVLKERTTYEIMDAQTVGLDANAIVLGKHSGRHALQQALAELGFKVTGQTLNTAFKRFKEIADKKKQVTAMDLEALVTDELREEIAGYQLEWFDVEASSRRPPHATAGVRTPEGEEVSGSFTGDGPVDAIFRAINAASGVDARLREFRVDAVTGGQDALGETSIVLEVGGTAGSGQGVSTDILEAAGRAYVRALSNAIRRRGIAAEAEAATAVAAPAAAETVKAP